MKINGKIMYHFNKYGHWQVGQIKDNTCGDDNYFFDDCIMRNSRVKFQDESKNITDVIDLVIENKKTKKEDMRKYAKEVRGIVHNFQLLNRELALEEVRKQFYPDRVSRRNCVYLCEKGQLNHWVEMLSEESKLFKVRATGEIFKSNDSLLPNPSYNYKNALEQAHRYWNPKYQELNDKKSEFLFVGELEIIEELDINKIKEKKKASK